MTNRSITVRLRLRSQEFARGMRRQTSNLRGFGAVAQRVTARAGRAAGELMDKLANPGAIAGTIGLGLVTRELMTFEDRLDAIRVNASATAGAMETLKGRIRDMAGVGGTHQGLDELARAAEILVAKDSALLEQLNTTDLLERIGVAATATSSSIEDVAESAYQLNQALGLPWDEVGEGLNMLAVVGEGGAFEMRDLAQYLPSVAAEMERVGQVGPRGLARTAAALQMVRRAAGDASTAANYFTNFLSYIQSPTGAKKLGEMGIKVFDVDGSVRDLYAILDELAAVTRGGDNAAAIAGLFSDVQARKAAGALIKNLEDLKRLTAAGMGADSVIDEKAELRVQNLKGALKDLKTELLKLAEEHGMPMLEKLTEAMRWLAEHPGVLEAALKIGAGAVGLAMLRKVGKGAWDLVSGGPEKAVQGVLGGEGQRVFVTNWPGGMGSLGSLGRAARTAGGVGGAAGTAATAASLSALMATPVVAASAGAIAGTVILGLAAGGLIGTIINEYLLPESFKTGLQDLMATVLSPFSEDAKRLADRNSQERIERHHERIKVELDTGAFLKEATRDV